LFVVIDKYEANYLAGRLLKLSVIAGAYRPDHDLEVQVGDRTLKLEVKSRSDFLTLHRWLDGADALVLRTDAKPRLWSFG
jgi:hypothetical protein